MALIDNRLVLKLEQAMEEFRTGVADWYNEGSYVKKKKNSKELCFCLTGRVAYNNSAEVRKLTRSMKRWKEDEGGETELITQALLSLGFTQENLDDLTQDNDTANDLDELQSALISDRFL